jgi:MFS family permease
MAEKAKKAVSKHSDNKWVLLALLVVAQFMVILDVSIVNVALPSMAKALHFAGNNLQWVVTAYTLTFGGFLLLGGRAADIYGRRKIFIIAVTLFALMSLLCGLAATDTQVIIARAAQGLAAAFMSPAEYGIGYLGGGFRRRRRCRPAVRRRINAVSQLALELLRKCSGRHLRRDYGYSAVAAPHW